MLDQLQELHSFDSKKKDRLLRLETMYGDLDSQLLLHTVINEEFKNEIALFSSFGADSALLIALVAEVNPATPILFLDTEKHFPETLAYVETLRNKLGLTDIRFLKPAPDLVNRTDPKGDLWSFMPNRCCWMRKVEPLNRAVKEMGIKALITGRKRYQTPERANMTYFQLDEEGVFRINPLAYKSKAELKAEFEKRGLPQHPLVALGYKSIGCAPCTLPVAEGQDERAGRWAFTANKETGEQKTECGIHLDNSQIGEWSV
jgi:phosphoadenosine phosphosulfate reductase